MGKASGTSQQGVVKPKVQHVTGEGVGASFGGEMGTQQPTSANACLFSLALKIKYATKGTEFAKGDSVTLVRVAGDTVAVFVRNQQVTLYSGTLKAQLLKCMAKGYVYSGKIEAVGANTLRAVVRGGVIGYASA